MKRSRPFTWPFKSQCDPRQADDQLGLFRLRGNRRRGPGTNTLYRMSVAAAAGNTWIAVEFLKHGAPVDGRAGSDNTDRPLYKAASEGHLAMVELLLVCGASIDAKSINGETALHTAASKGHETGCISRRCKSRRFYGSTYVGAQRRVCTDVAPSTWGLCQPNQRLRQSRPS